MKEDHQSSIVEATDNVADGVAASFEETNRDLRGQLEGKDARIKAMTDIRRLEIVSKDNKPKDLASQMKSDKFGLNKVSTVSFGFDIRQISILHSNLHILSFLV